MTLRPTRSASLRALALGLSIGSVFVAPPAPAQSTPPPDFVPGPSNPAPPYPAEMIPSPDSRQLPPVPMPQDRAADSYRIYSVLMPVGQLAEPNWPRDLWLLSDTTVALVSPDQSCLPQEGDGNDMNPHLAIDPPADRRQDFAELLADFDNRCHERLHLTPESFTLVVPLRLLNQDEQDEFIRSRFDPNAGLDGDIMTAHYKGAPGLSRFSEIYFNSHHTLAMVFANDWCGGLCAQSYWQVLEFQDGAWKRLAWRTVAEGS